MLKKITTISFLIMLLLAACACNDYSESAGPSREDVADLATEVINHLVREDFQSVITYFDSTMKESLTEEALREGWVITMDGVGEYIGEVERAFEEKESYIAVNIISEFTEGVVLIRIVFNQEKEVAGLWLQEVKKE